MKKILLITIVLLGILLNGCGSDANATQENNITIYLEDYSEALKYNYNQDKSAIQELLPLHVNRYEGVQKSLDAIVDDKEKFDNYYEWYVGDLISTQRAIDKHPSYAPRGEGKSLIVAVTNGQIDYSSYRLKGDIDENGEVDFDDEALLKEALLGSDDKYDINGDDVVDIKDTIDLLARLGSEIKTFDFYTISGEKLDIASRDFDESRSFVYSGSEQKVMVVAKDSNGVSGFTSGLSDMDTLWYIGLSTRKQQKIMQKEGLDATNPDKIAFVREAIAFLSEEPKEYLLGWKVSVKFNTNDGLDRFGLEDMDTFYFTKLENKIDPHFKKTDMGNPTKRVLKKGIYLYHVGAGRYEVNDGSSDTKYQFDLEVDSFDAHVKSFRKTLKNSTTINGQTVFVRTIAHASSVIFTSKENKKLEGNIKKNGEDVKGGVVKIKRIGPDPKEKEYEAKIENSKYKLKDIPFGGYELIYINKCECEKVLESNYIFKKEENKDFSIDKKEVKVKLTIRDKDNTLLDDKNIRIEPDECMVETDTFSDISDSNARVEFNDVPIGKYKVYVDNQESGIIQVCKEFDGDALGKQLWDIDLKFISRSDSGEASDFNIGPLEWYWKKVEFAKTTDAAYTFQEAKTLFNHGGFYFPYIIPNPHVSSWLVLGVTDSKNEFDSFLENRVGVGLHYINNHYVVDTVDSIIKYIDRDYFPVEHEAGVDVASHLMSGHWNLIGDSNGEYVDTKLTPSQIDSLKKYKEFTFSGTSVWTNLQGKSTITIKFTPSK